MLTLAPVVQSHGGWPLRWCHCAPSVLWSEATSLTPVSWGGVQTDDWVVNPGVHVSLLLCVTKWGCTQSSPAADRSMMVVSRKSTSHWLGLCLTQLLSLMEHYFYLNERLTDKVGLFRLTDFVRHFLKWKVILATFRKTVFVAIESTVTGKGEF